MLLDRERACLVVVDVQTRLLGSIHEADVTVEQIRKAIRGFRIVGAPVLVTEQYRKGLGETEPTIAAAVGDATEPIEKMSFSCAAHPPFLDQLAESGRTQVVLCGIEAHVCVLQTAVQLVSRGYETYVLADAVSSRTPRNVEIALRRMEQSGVRHTSVEMSVFEMLHLCGTPEFKEWLAVIK